MWLIPYPNELKEKQGLIRQANTLRMEENRGLVELGWQEESIPRRVDLTTPKNTVHPNTHTIDLLNHKEEVLKMADPLKDLLDQLDNDINIIPTVEDTKSDLNKLSVVRDSTDQEIEKYSTKNISSNSLSEEPEELDKEEVEDEFEKFVIQNAIDLTNLVVSNCNEDRQKATEVIEMIEGLIKSQDKIIHGGSIGRLIQAIDTRSGITATVVKVLESQAKILSARKGPSKNIVNNTNTTAGGDALIAILESGMKNK